MHYAICKIMRWSPPTVAQSLPPPHPPRMLILRGPRKNLELTHDAEGWKAFLADPEKQWKDGRSAKLLAEAWEAASPVSLRS